MRFRVVALACAGVLVGAILTACIPSDDEVEEPFEPVAITEPEVMPSGPIPGLYPITFADIAGWEHDTVADVVPALRYSCERRDRQPDDTAAGPDGLAGSNADWREACQIAATLDGDDHGAARDFLEAEFRPWRVVTGSGSEGLFTGYYEPELHGARDPDARYNVPLYKRPDDLVEVDLGRFRRDLEGESIVARVANGQVEPYHDRAAIEDGAIADQAEVLAWVDDPVDAFFLHIQGSGRIVLDDDEVIRAGYAGRNGHPYVAIGGILIRRGEIPREEMSMQAIRAWIAENPEAGRLLMRENPSYIFMRENEESAPVGAENVPLTGGRSLAVDPSFHAYGMPVWVDIPDDPSVPDGRFQRLMLAQDTGGAIRGPIRGDVFWGHGDDAEVAAGHMQARGGKIVLLPRHVRPYLTPADWQ